MDKKAMHNALRTKSIELGKLIMLLWPEFDGKDIKRLFSECERFDCEVQVEEQTDG